MGRISWEFGFLIKELNIMEKGETPICPHCSQKMKKWVQPEDSTWTADFYWVCFNDECPYYVRGWDWMMETQGVKASYRHKLDPETGKTGPLPAWSNKAHRDRIVEE